MVAPQYEQELAHTLLVELLAHQFAMPVRWTETQDIILNQYRIERLIEIGPAPTLLNMAKKTIDEDSDFARGIKRKFLSSSKDYREICYDFSPPGVEGDPGEEQVLSSPALQVTSSERVQDATEQPTTSQSTHNSVPTLLDSPITALDAIRSLVAGSLKKSAAEVDIQKSIKAISGGRSTLQNEIIGDLLEEFGILPDGSEDTPIAELSNSLQPTYNGKPMKCLRSRIGRMMSAKMPNTFDLNAARAYLQQEWGLSVGRQDAVLLLASTQQPPSRLSQETDAKEFFDSIANTYFQVQGLSKPSKSASGSNNASISIDPEVLNSFRKEQSDVRRRVAGLLTSLEESSQSDDKSKLLKDMQSRMERAQAKLDFFDLELGEDFLVGVQQRFDPSHVRSYESTWNWAAVDLLEAYHGLRNTSQSFDLQKIETLQQRFHNRFTERMRKMQSYQIRSFAGGIDDLDPTKMAMLHMIKSLEPVDHTNVDCMREKSANCTFDNQTRVSALTEPLEQFPRNSETQPTILKKDAVTWKPHRELSLGLSQRASPIRSSFKGRAILITGAGPSSIGIALLPALLQGGAKVVVATSRAMADAAPTYQSMFSKYGGNGARLVLLPCNQASKQDLEDMIEYIYNDKTGLGWDLDIVVPFAALTEKGREIDNIDSHAELAHRAMLTNVIRLLGAIKTQKEKRFIVTRPALALLPLSPNIGTFGKDGLYSESKIGLTTLLNKWSSESWQDYLSICGVMIGWTKGTGLMAANDILASVVAEKGVRTFSQDEMASLITYLMTDEVSSACQDECLVADLSGGLSAVPALASITTERRDFLRHEAETRQALRQEKSLDNNTMNGIGESPKKSPPPSFERRVNLDLPFPQLPDYKQELQALNTNLGDMVDLESVVVVVGFSELGPWGNSRTRWEMEANGTFSPQGWIELAWMTGMIQHASKTSPAKDGSTNCWMDKESKEPIKEMEVSKRYESRIREATGLRLINPTSFDHPDRSKNQSLHEVLLQHDLEPFAASHDVAQNFVREHGDKVEICPSEQGDDYNVRFKKGAVLLIPKADVYNSIVGGQIPTGWDPKVYGVPAEICKNVDRCTLFALVCAAEAFQSAGITDVYELYKTIHVSELANCVGSGMGGSQSLHKMFRNRYLDRDVPQDILAETFINTTSAWLNMLLMSASGPIRTPVGACATALESLNQGYDMISKGLAKFCLVGGYDDLIQATSAEFARMKATNNTAADLRRGRAPHETSRPTASSRCGFVESEGCAMQLLTNAKLALALGLPIHSIVAHVEMASDGIGRSVPAPGKGIMSTVRRSGNPSSVPPSPLLDIRYRKRLMLHRLSSLRESKDLEITYLQQTLGTTSPLSPFPPTPPSPSSSSSPSSPSLESHILSLHSLRLREEREIHLRYGNTFFHSHPSIPPLLGALSVWNLTPDDLSVLSLHGTSTLANEKNEVQVLHSQLEALGRSPGNPALAVCQKYLTGHPKGAAAGWMLNGACQMLDSGLVPGNRNADDIDPGLREWEGVVFPNRTIDLGRKGMEVVSVTSFGFGQKGAQALVVHPRRAFATIGEEEYGAYCERRRRRYIRARRGFQDGIYGGEKVVKVKDEGPYGEGEQVKWLVDVEARVRD